jgi:NADH-ubiquinone oxidoreductase chain 3
MDLFLPNIIMNSILPLLAVIASLFVITTQNPIYSVFNLIVLYILVAFYLIFKGITYIGISYIIIYVGAIAILFLFILMMIDLEVVEKRNNNYLPLLCLLLVGSVFLLKSIVIKYGLIEYKNLNFDSESENFFSNIKNNNYDFEKLVNISNRKKDIFDLNINDQDQVFDLKFDIDNNFINEVLLKINDIIDLNYIELNKMNNFNLNEFISTNKEDIEIYSEFANSSNINELSSIKNIFLIEDPYYTVFLPDWENAVSRVTQLSGIGDILYSVYHSYIYILSAILLLGLVGAILLTAEKKDEIKTIPLIKKKNFGIPAFLSVNYIELLESEGLIDSFSYFIIIILFISVLLFGINTYLSLSMKYLDKEGGFECGFTSFVQTRERFNIVFYRVALLFLIFDLEIILIYPYTAIYHSNQSISKNNVLAFLYILVVGFIYELKEGALDIVKKAHSVELDVKT